MTAPFTPDPVAAPDLTPGSPKRARAAQRSHKSKKERRRKPAARIYGEFVERVRDPKDEGGDSRSRIVRVDADFAAYLRKVAKARGISLTEVTRRMLAGFLRRGLVL